jgi:uncharacterized protein (TIGR02271 family)
VFDKSQAESFIGQELRTSEGTKIGKIGQVYLDDYHDQPEWVTVNTGLFGTKESFVPLAEAGLVDGGIAVPYSKDQIKNAPNIDESGHLSEAEEQKLYEYFGIPYTTEGSTFADTSRGGQGGTAGRDETSGQVRDTEARESTGRHASGRTGSAGDDAMTRSEERLDIGTERVATGKARLRKYVVTENVTKTVPVSREEVRLEREPVTDANRGDALSGSDISEAEHEVTLNEERVVVSKEAVPVERVKLGTETVTDEQRVDESVRKEQIELDDSELPEGRRTR